jgi:hypothetical protein
VTQEIIMAYLKKLKSELSTEIPEADRAKMDSLKKKLSNYERVILSLNKNAKAKASVISQTPEILSEIAISPNTLLT